MMCPTCEKAALKSATLRRTVTVAGRKYVSKVPGKSCPACGAEFLQGEAVIKADLAVAQHIATHGPVTGEGFAFVRHALGIQAKDLAPLIGRRAEALSRWERGRGEVDRAAWGLLGAIVADRLRGKDETADRLRTLVRAKRVPATVQV